MLKILVTGGSGFIGTNMIDLLEKSNFTIFNYDMAKPRNSNQISYWSNVDILDKDILISKLVNDKPDYIVHLAARTDLNESEDINGYRVNIEGVKNIMEGAKQLDGLKKVIVASSMLVCKLGFSPNSFDEYAPNSLYGESKVLTEQIVKEYPFSWTIVRPTSIWGPWFAEPYKNFFDLVMNGFYFNIPNKYSSTKTYGFVENTCQQIFSLLFNEEDHVNHNYFYLGDLNPINITNWANSIRKLNNQSKLITFPKVVLKIGAIAGDFFKNILGFHSFPMNSFRYNNMTNNNIINDIQRTIEVTQIGANTNLDDEIVKTLKWIKKINTI
jgi:nucleoside-diphosphate-sugar epimerase